jgi:amino acid transporter
MLWIEAVSVSFILIVVTLVLLRHGLHLDRDEFHLRGVTGSGLRLGLVLALFSFVGFESATTLGSEARNPLETIPRAVIQSALLAGAIFIVCAYTEVLGLRSAGQDLATSPAPMRVLAKLGGLPILGLLIDIGALVSMFAGTLACITAAARVLLRMAQDGLLHSHLARTHAKNETPHLAVLAIGLAVLLLAAGLAAHGASGADIGAQIYAQMGSLAVYGFITSYGLVAAGLPMYLRRLGQLTPAALTLGLAAALAMLLALAGTLYPVPPAPYNWLPYIYLAYLLAGLAWFSLRLGRFQEPV